MATYGAPMMERTYRGASAIVDCPYPTLVPESKGRAMEKREWQKMAQEEAEEYVGEHRTDA